LILQSFHSMGSRAAWILLRRRTSSGSKSLTVLPLSTLPMRAMAPVHNRRASQRVVLPVPLGPATATLKILSGG